MIFVLFGGLINWITTCILVDSELFRKFREWCKERGHYPGYLVGCHLCAGTWIAFIQSVFMGGPYTMYWWHIVANALLYKAIGHSFLIVQKAGERLAS